MRASIQILQACSRKQSKAWLQIRFLLQPSSSARFLPYKSLNLPQEHPSPFACGLQMHQLQDPPNSGPLHPSSSCSAPGCKNEKWVGISVFYYYFGGYILSFKVQKWWLRFLGGEGRRKREGEVEEIGLKSTKCVYMYIWVNLHNLKT